MSHFKTNIVSSLSVIIFFNPFSNYLSAHDHEKKEPNKHHHRYDEDKETKSKTNLKAHSHDHALMSIVSNGNKLHVNIEIPGESIYGFERAPKDDKEKKHIENMHKKIESEAPNYLVFKKNECKFEKVAISNTLESDVQQLRSGHAEVILNIHYDCKRKFNNLPVQVDVLKYIAIKQVRVNVLSSKMPFSKNITEKSIEIKI